MTATREQAQRGAAKTNARHAGRIQTRRGHVWLILQMRPAASAEDVARELRCSPSTIRGDWRALRQRAAPAIDTGAEAPTPREEGNL